MIKVMIGTMKDIYFVCGGLKNGFYEKGERVALYQKDQKVIGNKPKNATVPNVSVLVSNAPFSPEYCVRLGQSISDRSFELEHVEFVNNSKELKELFKLMNKRNEMTTQMEKDIRKRKLSNLEKDIIKLIPEHYKWMARDWDGELMVYFGNEPYKKNGVWCNDGDWYSSLPLNEVFKNVKADDEKAWKFREEK